MIFRCRFEVAGGHVHCSLFSGKSINQTFAKLGDFVVTRGEEFIALECVMSGVEFLPKVGSTYSILDARQS